MKDGRDNPRPLEDYLFDLKQQLSAFAGSTVIPLDAFWSMLRNAYLGDVSAQDTLPDVGDVQSQQGAANHDGCQTVLDRQIADLRDMRAADVIGHAFFGTTAPSGRYWCNTGVAGFLECGAAGAFGGWQPGDDTGRVLVPGEVAYFKEDGAIGSAPASAFHHPIQVIDPLSWEDAIEFLRCGQSYE